MNTLNRFRSIGNGTLTTNTPSPLCWLYQLSVLALVVGSCLVTSDLVAQTATETPAAETAESETASTAKKTQTKPKRTKLFHDRFMRIRKDRRGRSMALETSIVRYELVTEDDDRITVDLIGAVHIGEADYYAELNEQFAKYECLLYELVAPEGTIIPKGGRADEAEGIPTNPIAALQMGMKSVLELEFQLELIDYTKDNFVHADMTPEEFGESMKQNDESIAGYALKGIGQGMALQAAGKGGGEFGMLMAMFSKDKAVRMRRSMAKQMLDMGAGMIMFEGKDGSTIIDHRNAKCMSVLEQQIAAGKKNLAIFYGAGHLAEMEQRLLNDFGMQRAGTRWLEAWKLR